MNLTLDELCRVITDAILSKDLLFLLEPDEVAEYVESTLMGPSTTEMLELRDIVDPFIPSEVFGDLNEWIYAPFRAVGA